MTQEKLEQLKATATEVRRGILTEVHAAKSGHPGGSLSVADIITYLYSEVLRVDPENPRWEDRDRLVLSKGHTCPALYAMLAEKGFFPKEELTTFRAIGSRLQGHPDMNKAPGIDFSAGSLGQGVSAACGMALAGKLGHKDYRVYTILGDGEMAFVAIALYFAILKVRPTPFCVMDEIEAALDEANVTRYVQYMRRLAKSTQFLVITHRRGTMEEADHLFGVTMQEKGVSRIIELSLDEAAKTIS